MEVGTFIMLPLLMAGLAQFTLVYVVNRFRSTLLTTTFIAFASFCAMIAVTDLFIHMSNDLDACILINDIQYIGNVFVAPLLVLMTLAHTGHSISRRNMRLLFVIPAIILILVWTDPWTHLFYNNVDIVTSEGFTLFTTSWGPAWFFHIGYSAILLVGAVLLQLRSSSDLNSRLMSIALISPLLFNATLLSGNSVLAVYSATLGYLLTSILVFWVCFRQETLDLTPIAYSALLDSLDDATIITNSFGNIIDANEKGEAIIKGAKMVRSPIEITDSPNLISALKLMNNESVDLEMDGGVKSYLVKMASLNDKRSNHQGDLMLLLDHTDMVRMNLELRRANFRLELIRSVSRHDLANQLVVLDGYSNLLHTSGLNEEGSSYLSNIRRSTSNISNLVDQMGLFGYLGEEPPSWYPLDALVNDILKMTNLDDLEVRINVPRTFIRADPMIERVLLNILENCRFHGGNVSSVDIQSYVEDDNLILSMIDNGVGVPVSEKAAIFERGHGNNHGFGLFACREILSLTGITIIENGVEGEGARFDIKVPSQSWSKDFKVPQP